jgi:hypothetical protein
LGGPRQGAASRAPAMCRHVSGNPDLATSARRGRLWFPAFAGTTSESRAHRHARQIQARQSSKLFPQAFPNPAPLSPNFSKDLFGGFGEFQGVASFVGSFCVSPNVSRIAYQGKWISPELDTSDGNTDSDFQEGKSRTYSSRAVIARSRCDEAIQAASLKPLDCFAPLAMTGRARRSPSRRKGTRQLGRNVGGGRMESGAGGRRARSDRLHGNRGALGQPADQVPGQSFSARSIAWLNPASE